VPFSLDFFVAQICGLVMRAVGPLSVQEVGGRIMLARLHKLAKEKLRGHREPTRIYLLGRQEGPDGAGRSIEYYTDQKSQHFAVGIGIGPDAYGTMITARELLSPHAWLPDRIDHEQSYGWLNHLRDCGALWLVPLLERFAAGEPVTTEAVLRAFEQQHGHPPPFREVEIP
jgi:hypothetical protein